MALNSWVRIGLGIFTLQCILNVDLRAWQSLLENPILLANESPESLSPSVHYQNAHEGREWAYLAGLWNRLDIWKESQGVSSLNRYGGRSV